MAVGVEASESSPDILRSVGNTNAEVVTTDDVVHTRVNIRPAQNHSAKLFPVSASSTDWNCEFLRRVYWHTNLVDSEVGVWTDDGSSAEVHALSGKVATEASGYRSR